MNVLALQILGAVGAIAGTGTGLYFLCKLLIKRHRKKKQQERAITARLETIEQTLKDIK